VERERIFDPAVEIEDSADRLVLFSFADGVEALGSCQCSVDKYLLKNLDVCRYGFLDKIGFHGDVLLSLLRRRKARRL
jgi:hypothetical protein